MQSLQHNGNCDTGSGSDKLDYSTESTAPTAPVDNVLPLVKYIPTYKNTSATGEVILNYNLLSHNCLVTNEDSPSFMYAEFEKKYHPLFSLLKNIDLNEMETLEEKAIAFLFIYNNFKRFNLDIYLDPFEAKKLDYDNVVVKAEIQVVESIFSSMITLTQMRAFWNVSKLNFSIALSNVFQNMWNLQFMLDCINLNDYDFKPDILYAFVLLSHLCQSKYPLEEEHFLYLALRHLYSDQRVKRIRESFEESMKERLENTSGLEYLILHCEAFETCNIVSSLMKESYQFDLARYENEKSEFNVTTLRDKKKNNRKKNRCRVSK